MSVPKQQMSFTYVSDANGLERTSAVQSIALTEEFDPGSE
jgi:hypothetical protein